MFTTNRRRAIILDNIETTNLDKKKLRSVLKERVAGLSKSYCIQADASIAKQVVDLPQYKAADTIFCFVGTEREIDTTPILLEAWSEGKRVCVPRCTAKGTMEAGQITCMEDLVLGQYGILEPVSGAELIPPEEINLAIVPCLSCSKDGRRLGYGGGYYDRYLRRVDAVTCVICRKQVMCEDIPVEEHDILMDRVISD